MARRYTKAEIDFLIESKASGMSHAAIAAALKTTKNSVRHQWQYHLMMSDPIKHERYLIGRRKQRALRPKTYKYKKYEGLEYRAEPKIDIPDSVWEERDRRSAQPRTVNMIVLGDPLFEQSALGKRRAEI